MVNNIKLLLELYKENKKQVFKFKLLFFFSINIILFVYIFLELSNPLLFNKINIQSNLLDKGVSLFNPFFNFLGLNIIQCKLLIILMILILLNIIIINFSVVLFLAFLIYLAKLWHKIQTNILINHENMKILDIKLQYLLSAKEKKDILDSYILDNSIKIDLETYNTILNSIIHLNDKKIIYNEIKMQITEYLTKIHIESQADTFGNSIINFTEFLSKLDTVGIIKGLIITGAIVICAYYAYSLSVSSISKGKEMSEAVLEANKSNTNLSIDALDKINKQIIILNENHNMMHEHTLNVEKKMGDSIEILEQTKKYTGNAIDNLQDQVTNIKNSIVKTAEWNDKLTSSVNSLSKDYLDIKHEIKNIIIEDSMTAQTILELKKNVEVTERQISILLKMVNYFHGYIIHSNTGNSPPIQINDNTDKDEEVD